MRKFSISIIAALIASVGASGAEACSLTPNTGALFVLQSAVSSQCETEQENQIIVFDGDKEKIEFSFKLIEILDSLFD